MRIALFTDTFDQTNGVAHTFRMLADHCEQAGIALDIFAAADADGQEQRGTVSIHRFRPRLPVRYYEHLTFDLAPSLPLLRQALARPYDLVHLPTPGSVGWHGALVAALRRLPIVGSYHTSFPDYAMHFGRSGLRRLGLLAEPCARLAKGWTTAMLRLFYQRCQLILVPSPKARLEVESYIPRPCGRFHRGVDTTLFDPAKATPHERPRALYVGRVSVEKNLDLLLDFADLGGRFDLTIVGDGPYRRELEAALPWARFTGYLRGEALAQAYASADVFLFPSLTDTLGNVVLEAKASGVPPIVLDPLGPGSLVRHGCDGFIARDRGDFLRLAVRLLSDTALRRRMGAAARASVLCRRWPNVFSEVIEQYQTVLDRQLWQGRPDPRRSA